jgi:formylglycine-generating enzyme required for sulfatase activity
MGDNSGASGDDAKPAHSVTITSFAIAKTETTIGQYRIFCKATGKPMPEQTPSWGWHDDDPMVNVEWYDAVDYCNWLTSIDRDGHIYRLPTEAEYEYAARGGSKSHNYIYSGSNKAGDVCWDNTNSGGHPHAVATLKPNELGIYDMSGNVLEWCNDRYDSVYYAVSPSLNPNGSESGTTRVIRGGSWGEGDIGCRVSSRMDVTPYARGNFFGIGFRVATSNLSK